MEPICEFSDQVRNGTDPDPPFRIKLGPVILALIQTDPINFLFDTDFFFNGPELSGIGYKKNCSKFSDNAFSPPKNILYIYYVSYK